MRIHSFLHAPFEGLGTIPQWAALRGHEVSATRFYAGDPLPRLDDIDFLLIMGGPMNVYEVAAYPWLVHETRLIDEAIRDDKAVLGICLGAQLVAHVLGARVFRNPHKEIGWLPVEVSERDGEIGLFRGVPKQFIAFHWHGDAFETPPGADRLAKSEACEHQAFSYAGKVVGLQFHLEVDKSCVEQLVEHCADELVDGRYI